LPQALQAAGYEPAIAGQWHLGHADRKYWPRQRGFDHQYGPMLGEIDYFTHEQRHVLDGYRDNKPLREKGYSTTLFGNETVKFIEEHDPAVPPPRSKFQPTTRTGIRTPPIQTAVLTRGWPPHG
jgi:arylsulfatase A-like enzyme